MAEINRVPISKRLILVNSISGIVTRILTAGVFAWVIQHLIKRIPEEELALLPVVLSITFVVPLLQTILTGGLSRFVTEAYARNNLDEVTRIVSSQFPLLLAASALTLILGGIATWNIHYLLNIADDYIGVARVMMFMIIGRISIALVLVPFNTGLFAQQRFVLQNVIDIGASILRIVLLLWFILGIGPRVELVVAAQVISQLAGQLATTIISMRLMPTLRYRPAFFAWATSRRVLRFSSWAFLSQSANMLKRAMDAPLLNLLSNPIAVNDFFLGSTFDTQLREISIRATNPLLPALTSMHAQDQHDRLASAYIRGSRIALWASLLLPVPLMAFSYDLFALYLGNAYEEHIQAATVMIILILTIPLTNSASIFGQVAYARGDLRPLAILSALGQLGNLALTVLLVGQFQMGAVGSAMATLLSFAVVNPFFVWPMALRTLDISWRRFFTQSFLPGLFPAIIAVSAGLLSARVITDSVIARVSIGIPISLAAYAIALYFVLKPADRADFDKIVRSVRKAKA